MNMRQYNYIPVFFFDLLFRIINISTKLSQRLNVYKLKLLNIVSILTSEEEYIFLKNTVYPYIYKQYAFISDKPHLSYKMSTNTFYQWNYFIQMNKLFNHGVYKSIPILSMEINDISGNMKYDLTEFVAKMRYNKISSDESIITIGHIISVWQLYTSKILDENKMVVNYINTDGDLLTTNIRDKTNIFIE